MSDYKYKKWLQFLVREHHNFGTEPGNEFEDTINELDEVYRKAEAFDEIDGYLTEAYENFHNMKDVDKRNRLIQNFISRKVTLLFKKLGDKYGYKESGDTE